MSRGGRKITEELVYRQEEDWRRIEADELLEWLVEEFLMLVEEDNKRRAKYPHLPCGKSFARQLEDVQDDADYVVALDFIKQTWFEKSDEKHKIAAFVR